jgi:glycosyltransferase involved in cell wall biosynthesis
MQTVHAVNGCGVVAVVIPCHESAAYLGEAVKSVQAQTYSNWELHVVDDGSTDDPFAAIAELVRADHRIHLVSQPNRGVAAARNIGAAAAGPTEYILFLDADDILEPKMLERAVAELDRHPQAGMVHCAPRFIDSVGAPTEIRWAPRVRPGRWGIEEIPPWEPVTPFVSVFSLAGIIPSLSVLRREVFDAAGTWDVSFGQHYEDTLLFLHVALTSEIRYLPERLVRHRRHAGQSTADREKFVRQEVKLYEVFREPSGLSGDQARMVREAWRFRERRVIPRTALAGARRCLRAGRMLDGLRFLGGASRIVVVSWVRGPGRVRC